MKAIFWLLTCLVPAGCHVILPLSEAGDDGGSADAARHVLSCGPPEPVGASPPTVGLIEPGIFPGGLKLVARAHKGMGFYITARAALDQPFGPWKPIDFVKVDSADPTFFSFQGVDYVITGVESGTGVRTLRVCRPQGTTAPGSCSPVQVKVDGAAVTDDTDGPTVRLYQGQPLMVLNISPQVGSTRQGDIYFARPETADMTSWKATRIAPLSQPDLYEDDPTIDVSADPLLVYAVRQAGVQYWRLWVAFGFSKTAPHVLETLTIADLASSPRNHTDPELFASASGLELYFCEGWPDASTIVRSRCVR